MMIEAVDKVGTLKVDHIAGGRVIEAGPAVKGAVAEGARY